MLGPAAEQEEKRILGVGFSSIYPHPYLVNTVGSSGILVKGGHSPALQNPGKRSGVSVVVGIVVGSVVSSSPSSSCSAKCNCGGPSWM